MLTLFLEQDQAFCIGGYVQSTPDDSNLQGKSKKILVYWEFKLSGVWGKWLKINKWDRKGIQVSCSIHFIKESKSRGRSRGRVHGVHTLPPWDDLQFSDTTGILPKKKLEQETSAPPPKKNPGSAPEEIYLIFLKKELN